MSHEPPLFGPDELADRAGVSRRTIRYYVQRGLLPAPAGLGRGKHYTEAHLARLIRIRELQEEGTPLERIADLLDGRERAPSAEKQPAQQSVWTRIVLGEDMELHLRGRRFSEAQLQRLIHAVQQTIGADEP